MKKNNKQGVWVLALCALFSCKKEAPKEAEVLPTTASFTKLMDEGFNSLLRKAEFDASNNNFVYTSPKGTTVTIDGTCLRKGGSPVSGRVTLEFFEAYDRADMIVANKPTMGKDVNGDLALLESGGQYYVSVKQDGVELGTTCGVRIQAGAGNSGGIKSGMSAWDGTIKDGVLTWVKATSWEVIIDSNKARYDLNIPGFGWYNCDRFYSDPRPKTAVTCLVPSGYANVSQVYCLAKSQPNGLGLVANGKWPVGLDCYLIMVTEKNGQYRWVTKEVTLRDGHTESFDLSQAMVGSRSDYVGHVTLLR